MSLLRAAWDTFYTARSRSNSSKRKPVSVTEEATLRYAMWILEEARKEIDRADSKASILLAASGVGIGALLAGLLAGSWTPGRLPVIAQLPWWVGVAAAGFSMWCLSWAVYPRRDRRGYDQHHGIAYYADVLNYRSSDELMVRLSESAKISIDLAADQIIQISRIVDYKYRLIRWGMRMLFFATASVAASLLIDIARRLTSRNL